MTDIIALDAKLGMRTSEWEAAADRVTRKFERMIDQQTRQSAKAAREMSESYKRGFGDIDASVAKLGGSLKGLGLAAAAALGVDSLGGIAQMADKFNTLEQRVKTATRATGDFATVNQQLFKVAQQNGAAFSDTVEVFQRLALASKSLGATNTDMIQLTDTVQKLGVIGGSSAEAMKAGLLQFGQAMSGGVVHAEEFNSLVENMPSVANAIAEAMGMTTAELRTAVINGKVLSKDVFDALQSKAEEVNKQFAEMPKSLAATKTALENSVGKFASTLDHSFEVTSKISGLFTQISGTLDEIGPKIAAWAESDTFGKKNKEWLDQLNEINQKVGMTLISGGAGAGGLLDLFKQKPKVNGESFFGQDMDNMMQREGFGPAAPKKDIKPSGDSKKDKFKADFESMLAKEQEVTKEYALRASLRKEDAEVAEAIFKIENGLHITLTDQQKERVKNTVMQREHSKALIQEQKDAAAAAKKVADEAKRQHEAYQKTSSLLDAQLEVEKNRATLGEYMANMAEKRASFEKQIADYSEKDKKSALEKYDALQKQMEVNDYSKKLQAISDETRYISLQGTKLEEQIPLLKQLDELREQGRLTQERQVELQDAFNKRLEEEANVRSRQTLKALKEQTEEMGLQESTQRLIDAGYYQQAEYMKEIYEFQKNVKREATDEEKAQISINTQQREYLRQAGQARELINSLQTAQQKWNKQAQDLRQYYENGFISLDQYRQAVVKLNPEFEKFRNMAKDVGDALSKGLDDWLTKGKKFTDVLKDIGKELASSAIKNLLVNPLQQGITNMGQNLLSKFVGAPTGTGGGGGLLNLLRAPQGSGLTQLPLDPQERAGMLGEMASGYRMKIWGANPAREITPDMDSYPGIVEALQKGGYTGAFPKTVADYNRIASKHNAMVDAGGANGLMTGGLSTLSSKYGSAPGGAVPVWIVGGASMGGPGMVPMTGMLGAMNNAGAFGGGGVLGGRAGAGGIAGGSGGGRSDEMTPQRWGSMTKGMQEQWMADTARHHATDILTGGNAYTPLEKSIAAVQYNGSGVWSPYQQFVGKGQSWGGGGGGGFALSGWQEDGPTAQEANIARERAAQNSRWAQDNAQHLSGAGGNNTMGGNIREYNFAGPGNPNIGGTWTGKNGMSGPQWQLEQMRRDMAMQWQGPPGLDPNYVPEKSGGMIDYYNKRLDMSRGIAPPGGGLLQPIEMAGRLLGALWGKGKDTWQNGIFGAGFPNLGILESGGGWDPRLMSATGYGGVFMMPQFTGRGYAKGGRPEKNKISMIGEDGPELWVPDTAGTVVPLTSGSSSGASRGASAPNLNVAIHNNTPPGYEVVTETRQTENGFEAHQTFRKRMQQFMRSSEGANLMRDLFAVKRKPA